MNLISFGIFGIIFLMFLAVVSNTSEDSQERIQNQMFLINCPLPSYDGQYNATNVTIDGFAVILNTSSTEVSFGGEGTVFRCLITPLTPFPAFQVIMTNKDYQEVTLGFPSGWFKFAGDFLGATFQQLNNIFQLIGFFVTPSNFSIFGFTLDDLGGTALALVISLYALCYVSIGILIYKVASPFAGVG